MNKFYFNDQEVKLGDSISISNNKILPNGNKVVEYSSWTLASKDIIKSLVNQGILKEEQDINIPTDVNYYIDSFRSNLGYFGNSGLNIFENMFDVYPMEALCILWRSIMDEFDSVYEDILEYYDTLYLIDKRDGSIITIDNTKEHLNTDNFIAFRSKEDAELAIKITKDYYNEVFGE